MNKLPDMLPKEFVIDLEYFCRMFYSRMDCGYGKLLQTEMIKKYPKEWLDWLFENVGEFE